MYDYTKLSLNAGNSRIYDLSLRDEDANTQLNLTGCKIRWVMKKEVNGENSVFKDTVTGGIVITNAVGGLAVLTINPNDTKDLSEGNYYHEAEVEDAAGNITKVFSGPLVLKSSGIY